MKHGTRGGWFNHGCRCDACWDARLVADRASRKSRRDRFARGELEVQHGRAWVAQEYGCKCEPCLKARNEYEATRRRRNGVAPAKRYPQDVKDKAIRIAEEQGLRAAAETCGVGRGTVASWVKQAGLSVYVPPLQPCGTVAAYKRGCRCEPCTKANYDCCRDVVAKMRARVETGELQVPHGTNNGYGNYGCRCDQCVAANSWASRPKWKRWAERQRMDRGAVVTHHAHHALILIDRGEGHVHRFRASCSCGWVAVNRRRKIDATKLYRSHVNSLIGARRNRGGFGPKPCTPSDRLPDLLRVCS